MNSEQQNGLLDPNHLPKGDLLYWVNTLLDLQLTLVQQLGTGAVYCQILDAMFPGKVPMQKINWKAKNEWEFLPNFKILQQTLGKLKIKKDIEIERLAKCKYQDNLQFLQWLKKYYDLHNKTDPNTYDPHSARKDSEVDFGFVQIRKPIKKKELEKLENIIKVRGKSPYDNVKAKIINRSIEKIHIDKTEFLIDKVIQIRDVIKKSQTRLMKSNDPMFKIKEIVDDIDDDFLVKQTKKFQTDVSKDLGKKGKKK